MKGRIQVWEVGNCTLKQRNIDIEKTAKGIENPRLCKIMISETIILSDIIGLYLIRQSTKVITLILTFEGSF